MIAFRITHQKYCGLLTVPGTPGRWNSKGNKVLYTASSVALALLENMYARKGYGFNSDFCITVFSIKNAQILEYKPEDLPPGWNNPYDNSVAQEIGDAWYRSYKQLVLKVPSAILPVEYNYAIHTEIPDWTKKVEVIKVLPLMLDSRIDDLVKQYGAAK